MNISEHITLEEAILSPTALRLGIDNKPNNAQLNNMEKVADNSGECLPLFIVQSSELAPVLQPLYRRTVVSSPLSLLSKSRRGRTL